MLITRGTPEEVAEKLNQAVKSLTAGAKAQHIFTDFRHD